MLSTTRIIVLGTHTRFHTLAQIQPTTTVTEHTFMSSAFRLRRAWFRANHRPGPGATAGGGALFSACGLGICDKFDEPTGVASALPTYREVRVVGQRLGWGLIWVVELHPRRRNATLTTPTKIQKIQRANPAFPDDRVSRVTKDIWTSDRKFRHSELQIQSCDGANFQRRRPITTINSRVNRKPKQMRERTDNPTTNASESSHAATELNPVTFRTPVWDKTPISGSNAKGNEVNTTSISKGMGINVTKEKKMRP